MASRRMNRTKSFGSYLNAINSQVSDVTARNEITSISAGAITGDSLAENVTLFGSAIQSSDYIAGSNGWKIDGTGVAEFADVFVRGDINAETGTIGYWNISSPGVIRTIGDRVLFGTFLESNDFGSRDNEVTEGVYVGLFKSYFEDPSPVTSRSRTANLATILIANNAYEPGDQVYVSIIEDTSFNNGGLPVTVVASTSESITYYNVGSDFPTYDANGIPASTTTTGEAVLYNPDVAGLYIRDYGKTALDYGYFSNQGVAYVSASRVNLVHNPSFEINRTANVTAISGSGSVVTYIANNTFMAGQTVTITDSDVTAFNLSNAVIASANSTQFTVSSTATGIGNTVANAVSLAPSGDGWRFGNATTNSAVSTFRYSNLSETLLTSSTFATFLSSSATAPSAARYFRGTINYSKGVDYNVFDLDKVLYLKYETHFRGIPYSALYSSMTATAANCVITTTTAHGFSVGDLVAIDFSARGNVDSIENIELIGNATYPSLWLNNYPTTNIAVVQVIGRTNTTFTFANPAGGILTGAPFITANTGGIRGVDERRIYKVPYAAMDLSQITFEFSNNQSVSVSNVINDMTTAAWATNANKYMSLDPMNFFLQYVNPTDGIPPLQEISTVPLMVDSNKLRLEYSAKDPTGYAAKNNITLNLPSVVYSQAANATTGTYTSTTAFLSSSVVAVTAISGNGITVTYTASNNFANGDRVTITGSTTTSYNLSNVAVATANSTQFTVTNGAMGATSTATATGYRGVSTFFDSVSFSTEPIPFFGDTSSDYSWENPALNSANQISLQDTKKWFDINLDDQTGAISNLDYLGFKQTRLNIPLLSQPSIGTTSDYNSDIGSYHAPFYDYENLQISGGVSSVLNPAGTAYNNFESKINLSSSRAKSAAQLLASFDDGTAGSDTAKITASVTSLGVSDIELDADTITATATKMSVSQKLGVNFVESLSGPYPGSAFAVSFDSPISVRNDGYLSVSGRISAGTYIEALDYIYSGTSIEAESGLSAGGAISHTGKSGTSTSMDAGVYLSSSGYTLTTRSNGTPLFVHRYASTGTVDFVNFVYNGSTSSGSGGGTIRTSAGGTPAFAAASDYRIKENITPVSDALSRMEKAKAYTFNKIGSPDIQTGFLAHELAEVMSDAVDGEKDAVDADGNPIYQIVMEAKLVPLMAQAINELIGKVNSLTTRIEQLEA